MKNTFTGSLSTKEFCPESNLTWEEFRSLLNPILKEGDESIETKIDDMIGSLEDYEDKKILATPNPQARVDELVQRIEDTFMRLNNFYVALGRSSLGYQASYTGNVNGQNGKKLKSGTTNKTKKIVSFALERSEVNDGGGAFEIVPTDEKGDTFTTHNHIQIGMDSSFFGAGRQKSLDQQISGYSIESNGTCSQDELRSTFSFLAQALVQLRDLRNNLESTQQKIDSINRINKTTDLHKESIQKALTQVDTINF